MLFPFSCRHGFTVRDYLANFTINNAMDKNKPRHPYQTAGLLSLHGTEQRLKTDILPIK
jgi:hypothetical protein